MRACAGDAAPVRQPAADAERRGVQVQVVASSEQADMHDAMWTPQGLHTFLYRLRTTTLAGVSDGPFIVGYLQIKGRREDPHGSSAVAPSGISPTALVAVTKIPIQAPERSRSPFSVVVGTARAAG